MSTIEDLAVIDKRALELSTAIAVLETEIRMREGFEKGVMIQASNMLHMERIRLIGDMDVLEKKLIEENDGDREAVRKLIAKLPRNSKDGRT